MTACFGKNRSFSLMCASFVNVVVNQLVDEILSLLV